MVRVELQHGCWQEIDEGNHLVITHFGVDDTELMAACPTPEGEDWEEQVARAKALGYQTVWEMTKDHDRIHMELAQAEGKPYSYLLFSIASGIPYKMFVHNPEQAADEEERRVFYVQRMKNVGFDA
jgi:hypothetical protein